jgi:hypothetical protein
LQKGCFTSMTKKDLVGGITIEQSVLQDLITRGAVICKSVANGGCNLQGCCQRAKPKEAAALAGEEIKVFLSSG